MGNFKNLCLETVVKGFCGQVIKGVRRQALSLKILKTTAKFRWQLYLPRRGRLAISPQNREIKSVDQVPALHWWTLKTATKPAAKLQLTFLRRGIWAESQFTVSERGAGAIIQCSALCCIIVLPAGHKKVCIIQPNGGRWYYCMNQSLGAAAVMDAAWSSLFSTGHEAAQGRYQIFLAHQIFLLLISAYKIYFDVDIVINNTFAEYCFTAICILTNYSRILILLTVFNYRSDVCWFVGCSGDLCS